MINSNNVLPIPQLQPQPQPKPTSVRNAAAALNIEERRLLMRHFRLGGDVKADVEAYKKNEQEILDARISAFTQGLLTDQQQLQALIKELTDEVVGDNPFEEYQLQDEIIKESIKKNNEIASGLEEQVEKTKQELLEEKQKKRLLIKSIEQYTEQVIKTKQQSSNRDAVIENVSTITNCIIASTSCRLNCS